MGEMEEEAGTLLVLCSISLLSSVVALPFLSSLPVLARIGEDTDTIFRILSLNHADMWSDFLVPGAKDAGSVVCLTEKA